MRSHAIAIVTRTLRRYRTTIWEGILLLAVMVVAALIAYEYDIFPNPPGVPTQEYVIEANEALALATLLCLGLLALSWHFLLLQRREVARRTHVPSGASARPHGYGPGTLPDRASLGLESETTQPGTTGAPRAQCCLREGRG